MLVKQDKTKIGRLPDEELADLKEDPLIRWQHKWYLPLVVLMGLLVPTLLAGLCWGDYRGGFYLAGLARLVFVHHSTFCVNSLAHYAGSALYSDRNTARDSLITAFVTIGEGFHGFHHNFPNDARNGIRWYDYDPTKW